MNFSRREAMSSAPALGGRHQTVLMDRDGMPYRKLLSGARTFGPTPETIATEHGNASCPTADNPTLNF